MNDVHMPEVREVAPFRKRHAQMSLPKSQNLSDLQRQRQDFVLK
jgi:hypothetical protein